MFCRSSPLPPITRLEDRGQNRRCQRLRRTLHRCMVEMVPRYNQAVSALVPLAEQLDLEKYYDIYNISDLDLQEARQGYAETEFEDNESLRVLKILVARLHVLRKIFLCCLLALEADGGKPDFLRWSTAVDEIHDVTSVTDESEQRLRKILSEEESKLTALNMARSF
jgi:Mysoin-binding motif of peroxisomes